MEIKFFENGQELSTHEIMLDKIDKNSNVVNIIQCCVGHLPAKDIGLYLKTVTNVFKKYGIDIIALAISDKEHQYIFNQIQIKGEE